MSWKIDSAHSHIYFTARHMMISKVRGHFEKFDGTINYDPDLPDSTAVTVEIEAASINTRDPQRDAHLRSPDFFDVEKYPVITFISKRVEKIDEEKARLIGALTIRGISREVVLDVEYAGQALSPWGTTSAGFSAHTTVNRKEWGLNWNQALETGGFLVGDKIDIEIELELIKQPEPKAELTG